MKTSIFDMNFVLPPLIEMTEVEKEKDRVLTMYVSCMDWGPLLGNC